MLRHPRTVRAEAVMRPRLQTADKSVPPVIIPAIKPDSRDFSAVVRLKEAQIHSSRVTRKYRELHASILHHGPRTGYAVTN